MGFGPFILISLFYVVTGVRVVGQIARHRRAIFDRQFTAFDRSLVDQAAFFLLVPIAVALHELGHAVAIWLLGGRVEGWGYYVFAGYVSFDPRGFSQSDRVLIALAGTIVNVLLAALALLVVFARRPPMRAAVNELLLQFVVLSLANALIFYPALDLAAGVNGDWTQIYRGGVPTLAATVFAVHAAILGGGIWALRNDRMAARIAALTGAPPGTRRRPLGGLQAVEAEPDGAAELAMLDAAERVVSGWSTPVETSFQRRPTGVLLAVAWRTGPDSRSVALWAPKSGEIEVIGLAATGDSPPVRRPLGRLPRGATADQLTIALRLAMETVDRWEPAPAPS